MPRYDISIVKQTIERKHSKAEKGGECRHFFSCLLRTSAACRLFPWQKKLKMTWTSVVWMNLNFRENFSETEVLLDRNICPALETPAYKPFALHSNPHLPRRGSWWKGMGQLQHMVVYFRWSLIFSRKFVPFKRNAAPGTRMRFRKSLVTNFAFLERNWLWPAMTTGRPPSVCVLRLRLYIHAARSVGILVEMLKSAFTFWLYVEIKF